MLNLVVRKVTARLLKVNKIVECRGVIIGLCKNVNVPRGCSLTWFNISFCNLNCIRDFFLSQREEFYIHTSSVPLSVGRGHYHISDFKFYRTSGRLLQKNIATDINMKVDRLMYPRYQDKHHELLKLCNFSDIDRTGRMNDRDKE
jgi:hypothetical protein